MAFINSLQDVICKDFIFNPGGTIVFWRSAHSGRPQPASRLHRTLRIAERPERTLYLQPEQRTRELA